MPKYAESLSKQFCEEAVLVNNNLSRLYTQIHRMLRKYSIWRDKFFYFIHERYLFYEVRGVLVLLSSLRWLMVDETNPSPRWSKICLTKTALSTLHGSFNMLTSRWLYPEVLKYQVVPTWTSPKEFVIILICQQFPSILKISSGHIQPTRLSDN